MPTTHDEIERRRDFVLGVGVFVLAAVVFLPTARFGFVNWDDPWYVVNNPTVKSWSPSNLYDLATTVQVRNFAPVTMFSYLVDHTLWARWAGGYHLTNTWLHALNAALVFALLRGLGAGRFVAVSTAALFAVHPVQVESVVWISARKGLLSGTFILASLLCWLKPFRSGRDEAWGTMWLALALLSKAIAVVIPAIVLLYDLWIRRRSLVEAIPHQVIPGFLAVWLLLATMNAQVTETGGVRDHLAYGKAYLIALDGTLLWRYVGHLVRPEGLSVLYDPPTEGIVGTIVLAWIGWVAVAVAAFSVRERDPWVRFGLSSALILMLPVLNLFPLTTLMNDRYLYLPVIPLFALAAAGVVRLAEALLRRHADAPHRITWRCVVRGLALAGVALACLVPATNRTRAYSQVWRDDLSLWRHARRHTPELPVVRIQYAMAILERGDIDGAIGELEFTLAELQPDEPDTLRIRRKLVKWRSEAVNAAESSPVSRREGASKPRRPAGRPSVG